MPTHLREEGRRIDQVWEVLSFPWAPADPRATVRAHTKDDGTLRRGPGRCPSSTCISTRSTRCSTAPTRSRSCCRASARRGCPPAITDHGNMFGAVQFHEAAKKAHVQPIIGCEMYVA